MKLLFLVAILFSAHAMAAEIEVICKDENAEKTITIAHGIQDTEAPFTISDKDGKVLGVGMFNSLFSGLDSFLNLFVMGYSQGNSSVAEVALVDVVQADLKDIKNGKYEGKSDLFVEYGDGKFMDGATLDCSVKIDKPEVLNRASVISCGINDSDPSPVVITKQEDPEFITHLVTINGETYPAVEEKSENPEVLELRFTASNDDLEKVNISMNAQGAPIMTLIPRKGLVIQKTTCEIEF